MPTTTTPTAQQLESAFEAFNQIGVQLASSYEELQQRVASLTRELSQARTEKLKQLAEKERVAGRLEKLLQALPGGVLVLDARGKVLEANPGAHQLLGGQLLNRSWDEIAADAFIAGGRELQLQDGRWVSLSSSILDGGEGKILLLTDVSEARRLQEMLNQHQRLTALGEMAAGLAHQIRTPLASVLLYLSQLDNSALNDAQRRKAVSRTRERLRHMEQMINNMLAYARGDSGGHECFPLGRVIDALEQLMEDELRQVGGHMQISNSAPSVRIKGNPDALLGALTNLAMNALQACDTTPELLLSVSQDDQGRIQIVLKDNGVGIDAALQEKIFEPFFTTRSSGTGLGLAVVKAVVQGHGGEMSIQSTPGKGTSIRISLPSANSENTLPASMVRHQEAPQQHESKNNAIKNIVEENEVRA
ncbi:sensor histidine kinase [Thiolapillus sp.]